ncbi:hypothetical protein V5799_028688 [Amblyomma americanum]|uniref:Lipase domain-containing protein n=1 Tax=Amblyomma americanum TaxID=6943 RepID=A0AAQ4DC58_AMBAM
MSGDCICRARFVRITVTLLSFSIGGDCLIFGDRPMSACYEGLGCLNLTNFYDPKLRFVNAKPWPRAKIDTRFLIYTPTTPYSPDIFSWNVTAEQLRRSSFDPSLETKVFVHGFLQVEKVPDFPMRKVRKCTVCHAAQHLLKLGVQGLVALHQMRWRYLGDTQRQSGYPKAHTQEGHLHEGGRRRTTVLKIASRRPLINVLGALLILQVIKGLKCNVRTKVMPRAA